MSVEILNRWTGTVLYKSEDCGGSDSMTWLTDSNNNRCSVEYFGSQQAAQKALDSLRNCRDCTNCSRCSGCSGLNNAAPTEGAESIPAIPVPIIENLHQKVYAAASATDALDMDAWHTCETTHCRAGWVVTLAGEQGKQLEKRFGPLLAAMKIYDASRPGYKINSCRFFDSNEDALQDMRQLAEAAK